MLASRRRMVSRLPRMMVRRLLKSWATPPVSCPTASIFCACRSVASAVSRLAASSWRFFTSRACEWMAAARQRRCTGQAEEDEEEQDGSGRGGPHAPGQPERFFSFSENSPIAALMSSMNALPGIASARGLIFLALACQRDDLFDQAEFRFDKRPQPVEDLLLRRIAERQVAQPAERGLDPRGCRQIRLKKGILSGQQVSPALRFRRPASG